MTGLCKTAAEPRKLKPGIYLATRNLEGLAKWPLANAIMPARHSVYVLIPRNPANFKGKLHDFGNGVKGVTMAGYMGPTLNLITTRNKESEVTAMRDWLQGRDTHGFDLDPHRINVQGRNLDHTIHLMLRMQDKFKRESGKHRLNYNLISGLGGYNCNSWAQSIGDYAGLKRRPTNMPGNDLGGWARIPAKYFDVPGAPNLGYRQTHRHKHPFVKSWRATFRGLGGRLKEYEREKARRERETGGEESILSKLEDKVNEKVTPEKAGVMWDDATRVITNL